MQGRGSLQWQARAKQEYIHFQDRVQRSNLESLFIFLCLLRHIFLAQPTMMKNAELTLSVRCFHRFEKQTTPHKNSFTKITNTNKRTFSISAQHSRYFFSTTELSRLYISTEAWSEAYANVVAVKWTNKNGFKRRSPIHHEAFNPWQALCVERITPDQWQRATHGMAKCMNTFHTVALRKLETLPKHYSKWFISIPYKYNARLSVDSFNQTLEFRNLTSDRFLHPHNKRRMLVIRSTIVFHFSNHHDRNEKWKSANGFLLWKHIDSDFQVLDL